jgi:hypothetical protein
LNFFVGREMKEVNRKQREIPRRIPYNRADKRCGRLTGSLRQSVVTQYISVFVFPVLSEVRNKEPCTVIFIGGNPVPHSGLHLQAFFQKKPPPKKPGD